MYAASPAIARAIFFGELAFFLLFKLIRKDLRCHFRLDSVASGIFSCLFRVIVKIAIDFTGCVQGRHPYELGGLYFMINLITTQLISFWGAYLYIEADLPEGTIKLFATFVWCSVCIPSLMFNLCFALFLLNIRREYIKTFFTTMTGPEFCCLNFKLAKTEEDKFEVFDNHPSYFGAIKDELKMWLATNWGRWNKDKPDWFTPAVINTIPNDILPLEELAKYGGKRTSSIMIAEQLRASIMGKIGSVSQSIAIFPINENVKNVERLPV